MVLRAMSRYLTPTLQFGILALFAALLLTATTHRSPALCNDSSRLAAAESMAHRGTLSIDSSYFNYCCDQIKVDGRSYSDKPPLLSVYLAGQLLLLEGITGWTIPRDLPQLYKGMTLLSSGAAFVAVLLAVRRIALLLGGGSGWWATLVAVGAGGATLMLPFSVVMSSHAVAAALLCWLVALVLGADRTESRRRTSVAAGLLAGAAPAVDLLTAPLVLGLLWLHLKWTTSSQGRGRVLALMLLGGVLPVALHGVISTAVSGNPLAPNLNPEAFQLSPEVRQTLTGTGWKHATLADLAGYAYHSILGYRGLFLYSPPALLGVLALPIFFRRSGGRHRQLALALGAGLLTFLGLSIGFSNDYSGYAYGVRWHVAVAPLLVALGGGAPGLIKDRRWRISWQVGLVFLFLPGAVLAGIGTLHPWTTSTMSEYSFREVSSSKPPYVKRELRDASFLLSRGKLVEAANYGDHLLRRTRSSPAVWRIAISTAARLGDRQRLAHYRRLAKEPEIPARVSRKLVSFIDQAAASLGSAPR